MASLPVWHLDSRAGAKPPELFSQLMYSQIPGNPPKPQTTAPQTDAAQGSGMAKAEGPTVAKAGVPAGAPLLPATNPEQHLSSALQSFTSQLHQNDFLLVLGW